MSSARKRSRLVIPLPLSLAGAVGLLCGSLVGCGDDSMMMQMMPPDMMMPKANPFAPIPECMGSSVDFKKGQRSLVISSLEVATATQGFDLDRDGTVDNKLGAVAGLANGELESVFTETHNVVLPMEFFGPTAGDSMCTKFAMYLGVFNKDRDKDDKDTTWESDGNGAKGDCNDTDAKVKPGAAEDLTNRMDDDCDGFADNAMKKKPSTDASAMMDQDGDGVSVAEGDCDDRPMGQSPMVPTDTGMEMLSKLRHPAKAMGGIAVGKERCDGIDYSCDGIPDNSASCDPFGDANVKLDIQKVALDDKQQPLLSFKNGTVKANKLSAGPSVFKVAVPLAGVMLDLELSAARVEGTFRNMGMVTYLDSAMLGGVLQAVTLAKLDKITVKGFLTPPQSLFDAVWANGALAQVLRLKTDAKDHYLPDMDVDGDGLETFWASDPTKMPPMVDTCQDGDGTIIKNGDTKVKNDDPMKRCVFAKDDKGNFRFVDGISAALKFKAVPARMGDVVDMPIK